MKEDNPMENDLAEAPAEELAAVSPELAEDLRRAQPNPPLVAREADDANADIDLGPMEDREGEHDAEELRRPVEVSTVDPLEREREEREQPGPA
ncbi:MAG: hypothetical protein M3024_15125 [Candidatus Dormibacteraeota bacterium]|nr:hypothetical protein [Candidatus Dormibacteraeota bacterium]